MPSLGPAEILVIFVVALMVFGPNRLPEIARQVGKGFREFRRVQDDIRSELRSTVGDLTPSVASDPVPSLPPRDTSASEAAERPEDATPPGEAAPEPPPADPA